MRTDSLNHAAGWRTKLINPVLNKEFTLRMRSPRAMWALFTYLLVMGLLTLGFLYISDLSGGGFNPEESRIMFLFISFAQLGLIGFMAPGLTAGVISGEREKQTLNLLLTTQQSSTVIIVSKLVSSLSFMLLITVATMPIYSIVFLFGGISPVQLLMIFLFYMFLMLLLGSFGVLFSTLFKRTMVSVIVTYGATLLLFAGPPFLFLVLSQMLGNMYNGTGYSWLGHLLAVNPVAAMYSILDPDVTRSAFQFRWNGMGTQKQPLMELWQEFVLVYIFVIAGVIALSIRFIRPRLK